MKNFSPLLFLLWCSFVLPQMPRKFGSLPTKRSGSRHDFKSVRTFERAVELLRQNRNDDSDVPSAIRFYPGRYEMNETVVLPKPIPAPPIPLLIEGIDPPQDAAACRFERVILPDRYRSRGGKILVPESSRCVEAKLTGTAFDAPEGENPKSKISTFTTIASLRRDFKPRA